MDTPPKSLERLINFINRWCPTEQVRATHSRGDGDRRARHWSSKVGSMTAARICRGDEDLGSDFEDTTHSERPMEMEKTASSGRTWAAPQKATLES